MTLQRIQLVVLIVLGSLACLLTRFLDMTFVSGLVHPELGAETISDERRLQLVEGLHRGTSLQFRVNEYTWWVVVAMTGVAIWALALSFRNQPKKPM